MNIAVALFEGRPGVEVVLNGVYRSPDGRLYTAGRYRFTAPVTLAPEHPSAASFVIEDVTIGIGFHWERSQRQSFRGGLRVVPDRQGWTAINDVALEDYVESVIASEMNARNPFELLRAHAVISRSWLLAQIRRGDDAGAFRRLEEVAPGAWELVSWYGRESHRGFDVCADDHCQRYQGIREEAPTALLEAVRSTAGELLGFGGQVCDARFAKCCGGVTEDYRAAWDDREVPYLRPLYDGPGAVIPACDDAWMRGHPPAYCNTRDPELLARMLPGFDQETFDFYRWQVDYDREELSGIVRDRSGVDLGPILRLTPLARGRSGRITRLRLEGARATLTVSKELEIRRVLSRSHLYSSAFVIDQEGRRIRLVGAGWGHGVGLCQIGAAVMAAGGASHRAILEHYYPGATVEATIP